MTPEALAALFAAKTLLIFDFDGTLADSSPLHARAFNAAFAPWNVEVDYTAIAGLTTEAAVAKIIVQNGLAMGPDERRSIVSNKRAVVRRLIDEELTPINGAVAFVGRAKPRYKLALCTSGSRGTVTASLDRIGLAGCFDPVITAEDVRSKPDPEGYLRVLAEHQTFTKDALVFEDSASGLAAAEAAGIDAICIVEAHRKGVAPGPCLATSTWPPLSQALAEPAL